MTCPVNVLLRRTVRYRRWCLKSALKSKGLCQGCRNDPKVLGSVAFGLPSRFTAFFNDLVCWGFWQVLLYPFEEFRRTRIHLGANDLLLRHRKHLVHFVQTQHSGVFVVNNRWLRDARVLAGFEFQGFVKSGACRVLLS